MQLFQLAGKGVGVGGRENIGGASLASQARHKYVAQIETFASRIVVTSP
jgi:hypothetical protein